MTGHEITVVIPREDVHGCSICGGIQGSSLPTDCPGRPMTLGEEHEVLVRGVDFREGAWVNGRNAPTCITCGGANLMYLDGYWYHVESPDPDHLANPHRAFGSAQ
jgi:hypothetical protein